MDVLRRRVAWGVLSIGVLAVAGCTDEGQIAVTNNAEADVRVQLGEAELGEVSVNGGVVTFTNECYDGPMVVTYADGGTVTLQGPACPGRELVISDETAELVEISSTH